MKISNLSKKYGNKEVLKNINLEIKPGEKVALLGSNGAGKSTLMNLINKSLYPSSGNIDYSNFQLSYHNSGYIMQNMSLPPDAMVNEVMDLLANDKATKFYGNELLNTFRMESFAHQKVNTLSGGQKQKLFLVSTLQNKPKFFFLDEITTGLDSESRSQLFGFLTENINVQKSTVLLVTHYIEEALQLCNRFIILKKGEIVSDLNKSDLIQTEFSKVIFNQPIPEYGTHQIAHSTYKIPREIIPSVFQRYQREIISYEKCFKMDLGELIE